MLVEFRVSNFRSFLEEQVFTLVEERKSRSTLVLDNAFEAPGLNGLKLLKTAAIYGPNASGKSNLLMALNAMKRIVTESSQRGSLRPYVEPFKLDDESTNSPSSFEIIFIANDVRYQYGFCLTQYQIYEEWLYAFPKGKAQQWFSRIWDDEEQTYYWKFSSNLLGPKQIWKTSTRKNALFLSTAVQLNSEQLKPIFDWFQTKLQILDNLGFSPQYSKEYCLDNKGLNEILRMLKAADLSIEGILLKKEDFTVPDIYPKNLKEIILKKLSETKVLNVGLQHRSTSGEVITFDLDDESSGTQNFFALSGPILDVLSNGYVLVIDELNSSLHPSLVRFLVSLFHSKKINTKNAQLIFTTHDTSILSNRKIFQQDQIWFVEKDRKLNSSKIYPLSDFPATKAKENLEAFYLSGRYGAVPFLSDFALRENE